MAELKILVSNYHEVLPRKLCIQISISVIQELLYQVFIIKTIKSYKIEQSANLEYDTAEQRLSDIFLENEQDCIANKRWHFIETAMRTLIEELQEYGTYEKFKNIIEIHRTLTSETENTVRNANMKETEFHNLQKTFDKECQLYVEQIENCMIDIGKIKDEIENLTVENNIKIKYLEAWKNAEIEMNKALFSSEETSIFTYIRTTQCNINGEMRVHEEIMNSYNLMHMELNQKLEEWKINYDKKLEEINGRIRLEYEKQKNQIETIERRKELFLQRQREINRYKVYKDQQEKIRLEQERKNNASIKIQAWWRGTMVRKGLGRFKKKKDKKGKRKSGEKYTKN